MPRPHNGGIKRWCASDVWRLSVAYMELKSRIGRPRKTKIDTAVAHVTRDSDTTFKVKRSKVNLQGAGAYCGGLPHSLLYSLFFSIITDATNDCIASRTSWYKNLPQTVYRRQMNRLIHVIRRNPLLPRSVKRQYKAKQRSPEKQNMMTLDWMKSKDIGLNTG